jgi:outer membrane protein assembly factor BamB
MKKTLTTQSERARIFLVCLVLLSVLGIGPVSADGTPAPAISLITPAAGYNTSSVNISNLEGTQFWGMDATTTASLVPAGYPIQPVLTGTLENGEDDALLNGAHSVFVQGTKAYVASMNDDALEIVDVSSPASPTHVGSIVNGSGGAFLDGAYDVYVLGNYAYVASRDSDALEILSISNPASPSHVATVRNGVGGALLDTPSGVYVATDNAGHYDQAYVVSTGSEALQAISLADPGSPVVRGFISNTDGAPGNMSVPRSVFVSGDYAYVASEFSGLEIVDISNSWDPRHAGFIGNGTGILNGPYDVKVHNRYAYVVNYYGNSLDIIDVSDPRLPVHRSTVPLQTTGPMSVAVWGIYAYVGTQNGNALEVIDISNPAVPVHKGRLDFGGSYGPNGVAVAGNYAYVASNWHRSLDIVTVNTGAITATGLKVVSPTRITCRFPITGQPAGQYSVVVTNPDLQQAVLVNGFRVQRAPAAATEPYPGWKFRGVLNNTGVYNDGGFRPNGRQLWNITATSQPSSGMGIVLSSPAVANGVVYVGDKSNHIFAINAQNGVVKWRTTVADWVYGSPAVANGIVYVGAGNNENIDGEFYALNANTGAVVWKKSLPGSVESSPVVYNGTLYVGRDDWNFSAWNAATGAEVWRFHTADAVRSSPAVVNGRVFFATDDWNIFCLDATTGNLVWDIRNASGWDGSFVPQSSPAVAGGKLYIGASDAVYAVDTETGDMLYRYHPPVGSPYFYSSPAVANGLVYIGTSDDTDNALYALHASDLSLAWVNYTAENTAMNSAPAVANGVVYITSDRQNSATKGFLYAWNAATGAPIWNFHNPSLGGTASSPAVANGVVYFGTGTGMYAVGTSGPLSLGQGQVGVFRPSTHQFLLKNGSVTTMVNWGASTDLPVTGDWNGDGLADVGVFRPSTHQFLLKNGSVTTMVNWGTSTDLPVTGDWNGNGLADVGVFRPSTHQFLLKNGSVTTMVNWGASTDLPVTGDWNGNGLADVGVFRPSTHQFLLKNGSVTTMINWGASTDLPVTGDWNGNGLADVGVFRPSTHQFLLKNGSVTTMVNWGASTDKPVAGAWG